MSATHTEIEQQLRYQWAYSVIDSSRISTYVISVLLICYGSFRSLNMDQDISKAKQTRNTDSQNNQNGVQTIDSCQALFLPVGASLSLLVMFLFFDSLQLVFAVCTAVLATVAFAFLLLPMCQYLLRPCSTGQKYSFGICGRFTSAEILSFVLSLSLVCIWVVTGHWLLMDALGMGLCVALIALVRLPSLKVSTLLLFGLLIYDVFWVFFSSYIFSTNVMVKVATQPADNPIGVVARKLHLSGIVKDAPKLSLPGKLVFPSLKDNSHFSMLGLGDIVMPGLLLCFVLRYDMHQRRLLHQSPSICAASNASSNSTGPFGPLLATAPSSLKHRITYFHCSLIGYFVGLLTATVSSEVFRAAQPALLYLVPFTLLPILIMAYVKGDLGRMWSEPFNSKTIPPEDESPFLSV